MTKGAIALGSMVAVLEVGAFSRLPACLSMMWTNHRVSAVTSIAAGRVGDSIGRRGTLFIGAVVFTIGGAIQTFTTGFWIMIIGRLVSGFGVGLLSTIVPIYQSEISPPNHRGALACMEFTGNIIGYSSSVWTDYFCSYIESDLSWRIPLMVQCIIGFILAAGSLAMPESPRWLIDTDKDADGMRVLADLHGGDLEHPIAVAEFKEIKEKVHEEASAMDTGTPLFQLTYLLKRESGEMRSYKAMWHKYKRRVLLAMSSQAFAQLNGINVISYYAPRVFEEAGWIGRQAILMTGFNSLIYILSTLPPWYLVDRWGRRTILLSGAVIMSAALIATGWWMAIDLPYTPNAVVICVIIFNAAFGYSWGPVPWLYPPEIMPLSVRAKGVSLSTATNWLFNFIVGELTPYLQETMTWRLYPMHGFFLYPETKGVPLEEMDAVFGEDEREEQLDNESERSSLVSNALPTDHQTIRAAPRPNRDGMLSVPTFEGLGLHPPIVSSLKAAFPNVSFPTQTQATFIPAILSGQDVLLKDETGSGKSFGLVIALLNKPRFSSQGSKKSNARHITSLVLVPHRDLAYQFFHWIKRMATMYDPPPHMPDIAQVLVRDGERHLTDGIRSLRQTPPHILIGTPRAVMDVHMRDPDSLQLSNLSSVVVDEVDYLIETVPNKDPNKSFFKATVKAKRKLLAHPGPTRQILDIIYPQRKQTNAIRKDEPGIVQERRRREGHGYPTHEPQLILSSATLRRHLNNYLFEESGWLNRDNLLKVRGKQEVALMQEKDHGAKSSSRDDLGLGGTNISHSVLLVSEEGINNIAGAKPPPVNAEEAEHLHPIDPHTLFAASTKSEPVINDSGMAEKYMWTPTPFNPNAMEAIATAFALDVPSIALLVLPSSSPVQRAVYELREMGVNAHGLDLLIGNKGRSHLLRGGVTGEDNPTLLVSTLATTRGLDLPELTHVFILGIPDGPKVNGRTVDAYVHLAGRVGRFGRGGKVITVVEKEADVTEADEEEKGKGVTEGSKMMRILKTINKEPVALMHFD
ncbi:hypothetical protein H0H92_003544 [Tricholoma furcatifolium]|nr:hypothetical protein H0H92_003544 [Tricholoma furcatifolium]